MNTHELIDRLATELQPIGRREVQRRLFLGVTAGVAISIFLMTLSLGFRSDLSQAMLTAVFWLKLGYAIVIAIVGALLIFRLSKPAVPAGNSWLWIVAAVVAVFLLGIAQLALAQPEQHALLVMGSSALICPFLISLLSVPIFICLFRVLKGLAPTNLTLTGGIAGLLAGALAAVVYSFHCDEVGVPFLAIWYSLGIFLPALAGGMIGRHALRW